MVVGVVDPGGVCPRRRKSRKGVNVLRAKDRLRTAPGEAVPEEMGEEGVVMTIQMSQGTIVLMTTTMELVRFVFRLRTGKSSP